MTEPQKNRRRAVEAERDADRAAWLRQVTALGEAVLAAEARAAEAEAEADELLKRAASFYFRAAGAEAALAHVKAEVWDEGWELGNEYAISEPFDDRASKSKNPYREER